MILFKQDWLKYRSAIIDLDTPNRSFVRLASVYRSMGVENHAFILALLNPRLKGVDPFDPSLTEIQKAEIAIECLHNPWYFLREVARVPGDAGAPAVPFEANRGLITLWWCFFNHIMTFLEQIRQTGKSLGGRTLVAYLMNIKCQDTTINLLTKDDQLRAQSVKAIKEIAAELPPYLWQHTKEDANNTEEVTIKRHNNNLLTHVPQAQIKRAINLGRGLTSPIWLVDEGPFQGNIRYAVPAALASGGAVIERAKEFNQPYGTIFTSTAGKLDDLDGAYIYGLMEEAAMWSERFFDAHNQKHLEEMVRKNSRKGYYRVRASFNHRQMGKDDAWLRERLEGSTATGEEADRDYFNRWTSGSQSNPIHVDLLQKIVASTMEPLHTEISSINTYLTRWYIPENRIASVMANDSFILGLDTSDAGGNDDIAMVLISISTLKVVAAGTYNETNLITFSTFIADMLIRFPNILLVPERRSSAPGIIDNLLLILPSRGVDPFKRIFNLIVQNANEDKELFKEICLPLARRTEDFYSRHKKVFGFTTSGSGTMSRSELYGAILQMAAKRGADGVCDASLIGQITGLIQKNGRIDHAVGKHDDLVIAWLLTHWLLIMGKNLIYYGIDQKMIRTAGAINKIVESPEMQWYRYEQERFRQRVEEIYKDLSKEQDEYVCMRLEQELRVLDRKIILEEGEVFSVDQLIHDARETKRNRFKQRNEQQRYTSVSMHNAMAYKATEGTLSRQPLKQQQLTGYYQ